MQKNIVEEESVNVCRENLIIKENSSLSSHGLKPRGFSRSLLYKKSSVTSKNESNKHDEEQNITKKSSSSDG